MNFALGIRKLNKGSWLKQRKGEIQGSYFQVTRQFECITILQLIGKQNLIKITGGAKTTQSLTGKLIRKNESEIFISWLLWNHIGLKTFLWGSLMPCTYPNNEDLTSIFWVSTMCHSLLLSSDTNVTMYTYMYRTLSRQPQLGLLFSVSSSESHFPSRNTSM